MSLEPLLGKTLTELQQVVADLGLPKFTGKQIAQWLYQKDITEINEMTNLSKVAREKLSEKYCFGTSAHSKVDTSVDGTKKYLYPTSNDNFIESAYIPDKERATLCVSSQVGCKMGCLFCMTARMGFNGHLSAGDIINQVRSLPERQNLTNIVYMGMGEPLMNFDNVVSAVRLMMEDNAYGLSKRRVTLSTAGVVPAIDKLKEVTDVSLAISLHAPNDELRDQLVPINKRYPIKELIAACNRYLDNLNDRRVITIEYTLIDGVNDLPAHARELGKLLKQVPCKLNLIPFNPFPNSGYQRPSEESIQLFKQLMLKAGVLTTVRRTRGDEIDAACGQLVGQVEDRTRRSQKYIPLAEESVVQVIKPV